MTTRVASASIAVIVTATAAMCWLLYLVPDDFHGILGLGREGAEVFGRALLGEPPAPITTASFTLGLRIAMLVAWAAWIVVVATVSRVRVVPARLYVASWFLVVVVAVVMPPVLSRDAFGYVGYGNLGAAGLNPYVFANRVQMEALGDPLATFFVRDTPLGYGPGWAALATGVSALAAGLGLFLRVVVHKLVAALALLSAASGAERLASKSNGHTQHSTFLLVVLSPLMLVEGPGMGHNDVLMLALMVWAAVLGARDRWTAAAVLMGLACAVKPVAATALPLFLLGAWLRERNVVRLIVQTFVGAMPFVAFALFFGGPALVLRAMSGQLNPGGGTALFAVAGVAALGLGAMWVFRSHRDPSVWLPAWIPTAAVLILFGTQYRFPWYACWLVLPAMTGSTERHRILLTGAATIAVLLSWLYTV